MLGLEASRTVDAVASVERGSAAPCFEAEWFNW
ncbi:hypothetical protein J2W79_002304 [Methylorubrum extorquens]|nr:hypothetical protein [Methylorubrum extorquens]